MGELHGENLHSAANPPLRSDRSFQGSAEERGLLVTVTREVGNLSQLLSYLKRLKDSSQTHKWSEFAEPNLSWDPYFANVPYNEQALNRGQGGSVGWAALHMFLLETACKSPLPQKLDLASRMPDKDFNKSQMI